MSGKWWQGKAWNKIRSEAPEWVIERLEVFSRLIALTTITAKISPKINQAAFKPVVYATGIIAAFWCVERICGF